MVLVRRRGMAILICLTIYSITFIPSSINSENGAASDEINVNTLGLEWKVQREEDISTLWKLDWSPDGSKIAAVYFDNTTKIYDSGTGEVLKVLNGTTSSRSTRCDADISDIMIPMLRTCDWSPNGKYIATAGNNMVIHIYETENWKLVKELHGHESWILCLDWSPDSSKLASGSGTDRPLPKGVGFPRVADENALMVWDFESGQQLLDIRGHEDGILSVKWSRSGDRIATASDDRTAKIWNATDGNLLMTLGGEVGHSGGVLDVDWSLDDSRMVSGSRDYKLRLWNLSDGQPIGDPWKDDNCVRSVQWHPNGEIIASSGVDSVLKIRNGEDGTVLRDFPDAKKTRSVVMCSRWSPDGLKLAAGAGKERTLRVYSFGQASPSGEDDELIPPWLPGVFILASIGVAGIILIYYPIIKQIRERRK